MNVGLSFLRGMVAAVNPCGFVLLPTYLMYFLGLEATPRRTPSGRRCAGRCSSARPSRPGSWPCSSSSAGVTQVVHVVGASSNAKYVTGIVGVVFVVLGMAMLFGYKLPLRHAGAARRRRATRTVRSMFVYGIVYAMVSLSCTLVLFVAAALRRADGVGAGVVNGAAFALGMGLLVTALTVTLAVANHALLRVLRSAMQHVQLLAAAFVLLSGVYLLYYFWVVDVNERLGRRHRRRRALPDRIIDVAQRQLAARRRRARRDRRRRRSPTSASDGGRRRSRR